MWNQVGNLGTQGVCFVRLFLFLFFILKASLRFSPSLLPFPPLSHGFVPGRGGREGEALAPRTSRPSDFKERQPVWEVRVLCSFLSLMRLSSGSER